MLIGSFNKVLDYLTGGIINDILFGSAQKFEWNKIPMQFWWFVIISIIIFSLIFTIQMIILIFQEAAETKTKFVVALQNGLKAFTFIFLIPIFFFLANFIIQNLAYSIRVNFGSRANLAGYLWHIGDPAWDGKNIATPNDYGPPSNIDNYNMMAQIFGTWIMLITIFLTGIALIQKILELFFLFVVAPIVMIVMVIDNGKAAFMWKDMVIAKFLASTATLTGYYIFISAIAFLLASGMPGLEIDGASRTLFLLLFLCGGGFAATGFSNMVGHFIGESVGVSEISAAIGGTVMGAVGMAAGGVGIMKNLNRIGKNKRRKRNMLGNSNNALGGDNGTDESNKDNSHNSSSATNNGNVDKGRIDFNPFRNATNAMTSRSGIIGLAGEALGRFGSAAGNVAAQAVNGLQSLTKNHEKTKKIKKNKSNNSFKSIIKNYWNRGSYNVTKAETKRFTANQPKTKAFKNSKIGKILIPQKKYNDKKNKKNNQHQSK